LLPQEETLEILKQKGELFIGIPKEDQSQEKRVCLTPDAVNAIVANGHRILIESGAGEGAFYSDIEYTNAGAEVTKDTKKVFSCPLLLKVAPPTLAEIELMKPKTVIISALQLKTRSKEYFDQLAKKRITGIAFEYIKDEDHKFPVLRSLSEIAGISSILIASEILAATNNGNGLMFGNISGVPPIEVVIIGAGLFDNSITKLRNIQTNLKQTVYTSTIQPKNLLKALRRCDVAIGAIRGKDRSPVVVSSTMVEHMKKGAVVIDVSIDTGGCFETSEVTSHECLIFLLVIQKRHLFQLVIYLPLTYLS